MRDDQRRRILYEECRKIHYASAAIMLPELYGKWEWIEAALRAMKRVDSDVEEIFPVDGTEY